MKKLILSIAMATCLMGAFAVPVAVADSGPSREPMLVAQGANPCPSDHEYIGGTCVPKSQTGGEIAKQDTVGKLMLYIIRQILLLSGMIAVLFIIIGGFQYMTAGGNAEQAEKGRNYLVNAIIGIVIIMLSFTIVTIITNTVAKGV